MLLEVVSSLVPLRLRCFPSCDHSHSNMCSHHLTSAEGPVQVPSCAIQQWSHTVLSCFSSCFSPRSSPGPRPMLPALLCDPPMLSALLCGPPLMLLPGSSSDALRAPPGCSPRYASSPMPSGPPIRLSTVVCVLSTQRSLQPGRFTNIYFISATHQLYVVTCVHVSASPPRLRGSRRRSRVNQSPPQPPSPVVRPTPREPRVASAGTGGTAACPRPPKREGWRGSREPELVGAVATETQRPAGS